MSSTTQRPTLFVIAGEAQFGNERRSGPPLVPVPPPKPTQPQQLTLQGVPARTDMLVSLGLQELDFATFSSVLRAHSARVLLDLRISPSFRGSGFSVPRVQVLFASQQIHYRRLPSLVNSTDDMQLDPHVRQRQYAAFLEEQKPALVELRALIRRGPAVLLGWASNHQGSDRAVLVDVLQRVSGEPFELAIVD
jgi:hypothetical protein